MMTSQTKLTKYEEFLLQTIDNTVHCSPVTVLYHNLRFPDPDYLSLRSFISIVFIACSIIALILIVSHVPTSGLTFHRP